MCRKDISTVNNSCNYKKVDMAYAVLIIEWKEEFIKGNGAVKTGG